MSNNQAILEEIRANFQYASSYWREIRKEAETDVLYATRGPWSAEEYKRRDGRPTLALDELGQYLNQLENQARQNKRAVKVNPQGEGANDQTAEMRGGMIRGIEYKSKAQQAYVGAFGDCVRRSYGYFKLTTDFEPGSFNRVVKVVRVQNPDVIYLDPDAKEADWSDCGWSFEIDRMREKAFVKRWPKAEVRSFTEDHIALAPLWITRGDDGKHIQVASYCKLEQKKKKLVLMEDGSTLDLSTIEGAELVKVGGVEMVNLPDGKRLKALDSRDDNDPTVTQYVTNGIEILETNPLDWNEVPIIPVFAREVWVSQAGVAKREFHSLVRMARDAYKLYCYARSAQCERAGMDPLTPYEGYEGQFDTQTPFETINRQRVGYVEFKAKTEATGEVILPMPKKDWQEPPLQQLEILAEAARRAIQAAMGGSPLPTAAQRQNEKSGVALSKIEQSADQGNFHFLDNFDRALERSGRMMDAVLDVVYDTPNRQVPFNDEDGEHKTVVINQHDPNTGERVGFHTGTGDHGVTISTGPSYQSQRDAADDFLDKLAQNEAVFPKIADLVVKLKALGPIGDQIVERLAPPGGGQVPPELAQQIQQGQATIQQLQQELLKAKAGDEIKRYVCDQQERTKRILGLATLDQADAITQLEQELGVVHGKADRAHDALLAGSDQQHELQMKTLDQQHQREMGATQQGHEAEQQTSQQAAAAASQSAEHSHAAEQAKLAAKLAPKPKLSNKKD